MKSIEELEKKISELQKLKDDGVIPLFADGMLTAYSDTLELVKNCSTLDASQRYTDKDMETAYDKGYMDGAHTTSDPY